MEKKVVKIPHIAEELRIGYSFNYLIKVIAETDAAEAVLWDFADANFLHPFFLAPLAIYKNVSGKDSCKVIHIHDLSIIYEKQLILIRSNMIP